MEKNNTISKLYNFVLTIQLVLLFLFIVQNMNDLTAIDYDITMDTYDLDFELNLYATFGIIAALYLIVVIFSINIMGSGLNEEGTKTVARILGILAQFALLTLGTLFYLGVLGFAGMIIQLIFIVIYVLGTVNRMAEGK